MPSRERRMERAERMLWRDVGEAARELRQARLRSGISLEQVAAAVGVGRSTILRNELARQPGPRPLLLARHAAAVGMQARIHLYPGGSPIHDAAQLELMRRFRQRMGPVGRWQVEVPIPVAGDQRAFDAVLVFPDCRIGLEFFVRLQDCQAQLRSAHLKQRDAGLNRLVVVLKATHTNRRALREAWPTVAEAFPIASRQVLAALRDGHDPGGNGIIVF